MEQEKYVTALLELKQYAQTEIDFQKEQGRDISDYVDSKVDLLMHLIQKYFDIPLSKEELKVGMIVWDKKENRKKQIINLSDSHEDIYFNNLDFNPSMHATFPNELFENSLGCIVGNSVSYSCTKFENDRFFRMD